MDLKVILIFCICSDFLKIEGRLDNDSFQMSDAEVLTLAIVSALFFTGNHEKARIFLHEYGYIPNMLSKSQLKPGLCVQVHLGSQLWLAIFMIPALNRLL